MESKKGSCAWCGEEDTDVRYSESVGEFLCVENCWCPDDENLMAPSVVVILQ